MAYRILAHTCISCGICINKCPNEAVYVNEQEQYAIAPSVCVECINLSRRQCDCICPVGAIQPDPDCHETPNQLWAKLRARHSRGR